ncbi:MAG: hypothetical protein PVS2B2_14820 [Candidatus Acidiferrum sp.]
MTLRRYSILLAAAVLALTGSAVLAQGQGNGNGNGHGNGHGHGRGHNKGGDEDSQGGGEFTIHDREVIRGWYGEHEQGLPPGLAKRDRLPPGLERQLRERGTLPPGLQKKIQPIPEDLDRRLPPPPDGYRRVIIGGHIVTLNIRTNYVSGIFHIELP